MDLHLLLLVSYQYPTTEALESFAGSPEAHAHLPGLSAGRLRLWLLSPDLVDKETPLNSQPPHTRILITVVDLVMKGTGRRRKLRQIYARLQQEYTHEVLDEAWGFIGVNQEVLKQWIMSFNLPILAFHDHDKSVEIVC